MKNTAAENQAIKLVKSYMRAYEQCLSDNTIKNRYLKFTAHCKENGLDSKEIALNQVNSL